MLKAVAEQYSRLLSAAVVFNAMMSPVKFAETVDSESVVECPSGCEREGLSWAEAILAEAFFISAVRAFVSALRLSGCK